MVWSALTVAIHCAAASHRNFRSQPTRIARNAATADKSVRTLRPSMRADSVLLRAVNSIVLPINSRST